MRRRSTDTCDRRLRIRAEPRELLLPEHGDMWYVSRSRSRDALQAKMNEVARVTLDLKWQRYLLIKYTAEIPWRDNWDNSGTLQINDERRDDGVIYMASA